MIVLIMSHRSTDETLKSFPHKSFDDNKSRVWYVGFGVRSNVPGAHNSQQQSWQLHAQHGGHSQNERIQTRSAEEVAILETEFHVLAVELRSVARQRLFDHKVRGPSPTDAATALDDV